MITQIAAFISSFWEEEGGPELVVGSNDVGFDSWQEKLERFTCFLVQKDTVCGAGLGLLWLLGASPGRRCSKMALVGSVCACCCALTPHFNSDLCWAHWSSNFTLGDFHYGRVPPVF